MAKTTRIEVAIVRSTEKAHLVSANGQQGWIQKRWIDAANTVSETTFAKAVAGATERVATAKINADRATAERLFRNSDHAVAVVKETEKAVAAEVTVVVPGGFEETRLVWFPKSAIGGGEGVAIVAGWMIRSKEEQVTEGCTGSNSYERHRFCKGERTYVLRGVQVLEEAACV